MGKLSHVIAQGRWRGPDSDQFSMFACSPRALNARELSHFIARKMVDREAPRAINLARWTVQLELSMHDNSLPFVFLAKLKNPPPACPSHLPLHTMCVQLCCFGDL